MDKNTFNALLAENNLNRKDFAFLSGIQYATVGRWNDENRPIPNWVESWLDNYKKAKNYETIRKAVLENENLFPIIMEKILRETDERYEEQAYYLYNHIRDVEQTIMMLKIASSIDVDVGHLKGCKKEDIKKLYNYLNEKKFKPNRNDEKIITDFMNTKILELQIPSPIKNEG